MIMDNRLMVARRKYDPDATRYINAVQLADGQALEPEVAMAVDAFVRGCKADSAGYAGDPTRSNWDAIQACCIMCGARTLSGALVPLKGTAPASYNFASGDYSRSGSTPGLKGDGTTKYLDSGRANNADPLNDRHYSMYLTDYDANSTQVPFGSSQFFSPVTINYSLLSGDTASLYNVSGSLAADRLQFTAFNSLSPTFVGSTRISSAGFSARAGGTTKSTVSASVRTTTLNEAVFARNNNGSIEFRSSATISWYSIGSATDLAALDARVSTLVSQIAAAIP